MASDGSVSLEVLNKIVNVGHVQRKLHCRRCKAYTEHTIVSYAKNVRGVDKRSQISRVVGRLIDYLPTVPLTIGNLYACTRCGKLQFDGGLFSDAVNKENGL